MSKLKIIKIITALYLCSLSYFSFSQSIEVSASVDKNPVMVDESFILSVVANGDIDTNAFDSSFLMKDFVVGRTSVSTQTKMINFTTTKSTTWSTVLIPRKQGRFTIPSFDLQGNKTEPLTVMVIPVSASKQTQGRDLYITTEVDLKEAYLQQQINYKVKLHLSKDLQRGSLSSPTLENADIRQLGKDKEYNEIIDGIRYRIIERSFAIVPQQSGTVTINGPLFEGEVVDNTQQSFGFFNRSKIVNRVGPEQKITVKPIPTGYKEHWLPSEYVQVNDEWQFDTNKLVAGEPVTRTITLTAMGVVEEQLPDISSTYPSSVKTYPDKAETATIEKNNTLVAQRKESIAIIPNEAGELLIPEVKIPWFNTVTEKTEFATLPAKTIQIKPAKASLAPPPVPANTVNKAQQPVTSETSLPTTNQGPSPETKYWKWLSIALALLWAITLLLWWRHAKYFTTKPSTSVPSGPRKIDSEQKAWRELEKSLDKNDPVSTQQNLTTWLACITNDKKASLSSSIARLQNPELEESINTLLASRYSSAPSNWNGNELHTLLRRLRKSQKNTEQTDTGLASLYPIT
ncbi:BatD family protein [Paraglaciecola sp. 2405UD69-4]|uniref:BatD family protein n=1 Tax=Paraglaciecola sp. 2405UD69-4 TaxID=3391836 RepID=UPI0039C9A037